MRMLLQFAAVLNHSRRSLRDLAIAAAVGLLLIPVAASAQPLAQTSGSNFGTQSVGEVWVQLSASGGGGAGTYTWSVVAGSLPPGVSLRTDGPAWFSPNTSAGLIGIATTVGTYNFTLRVSSAGQNVDQACTLKIVALSIDDYWTLPNGYKGKPYSYSFSSTNGSGAWAIVSGLPPGMSMTAAGVFSGTPTQAGFYSPQVRLTSGSDNIFRTMSLSVFEIEITTPAWLPNGVTGLPYLATLTAKGGTPPYTFTTSNTLPTGLSLDQSSGVISGTPTATGTWSVFVTATDANHVSSSRSLGLQFVTDPPGMPIISGGTPTHCTVGVPCFRSASAFSGGVPPFTWTASGLPPGMSIRNGETQNSAPYSGAVIGAPTQLGTFNALVTATDALGATSSGVLVLRVSALERDFSFGQPNATLGVPYSYQVRMIGGRRPYSATLIPGGSQLTAGLSFDTTTFVLSGVPIENISTSALYDFTDQDGNHYESFVGATVNGPPGSSVVISSSVLTLTQNSSTTQTLSACCVPSFTWSLVGGSLPPGMSLLPGGVITGTPTAAGIFTPLVQATDAINPANFARRQLTITVRTPAEASFSIVGTVPFFGNVGTPFGPVAFITTGGTGQPTWAVGSTPLPPGLSFTSAGVLTGSPTASGRFSFSITATDPAGFVATRFLSFDVYPPGVVPPLSLSFGPTLTTSLSVRSQQLVAAGGVPPYHYSLTPGFQDVPGIRVQDGPPLPNGFPATNVGGWIGVLATPGVYNTSVRVTDSLGSVLDKPMAATVTDLTLLSNSSPPKAQVGVPYSFALQGYGGSGSYSWSTTAPPAGLVLNSSGLLAGTPLASGAFGFTATLTDTATSVQVSFFVSITVDPYAIVSGPVLPRGTVGVPYSQTLSAPGCGIGCTWSGTPPAGLALSQAGVVSGTPNSTANTSFTATVTGSNGSVSKVLALQVMPGTPAPLSVTNSTAPTYFTVGTVIQTALLGFGGTPPYSWSVQSGALPTGTALSGPGEALGAFLTPGTSYIIGKSQIPGTYSFRIAVTDATNATATADLLWIVTPLSNQYTSFPLVGTTLTYNAPYSQPLLVIGGKPPYTFVNTAAMPPGLALSAGGTVSGTPVNTGSFTVPFRATDSLGATIVANVTYNVAGPTPTVLNFVSGAALGTRQLGAVSSFTVTPTGGTPPYTLTPQGPLPDGFFLQPSSGSSNGPFTVQGIPSAPGTYSFTLQAQDSVGNIGVRTFTFIISPITVSFATAQPDGSIGLAYSQVIKTFDAAGAVTWSVAPGSTLPPGVNVLSSGLLSGTPTTAGNYSFTLNATDSGGTVVPVTLSVRVSAIAVTAPPILPRATLGLPYTYTFPSSGGSSTPVWSALNLPAGLSMSANGTITGTPTSAQNATVTVTATDGVVPWTHRFLLAVTFPNPSPLSATMPAFVPTPTLNQLFSLNLPSNGGVPPYTWTLAPGSLLPSGLELVPGTDLNVNNTPGSTFLVGVPTALGTYTFDLVLSDSGGAQTRRTLTLNVTPIGVLPTTLNTITAGIPASVQFSAVGGTPPYSYSFAPLSLSQGALPPGVLLSAAGLLAGTPTSTGTYGFRLIAQDSAGKSFTRTFSFTVVGASGLFFTQTPANLDRPVGVALVQQLSANSGPVNWSIVGTAPAGVSIVDDQLAGAPAVPGVYTFTVRATSPANPANTADHTFTYTVVPFQMVSPPETIDFNGIDLPLAHVNAPYTFTFKVAGGTPPYTFAESPFNPLPAGMALSPAGVLSGTPQQSGFYGLAPIVTDATGASRAVPGIGLIVTNAGAAGPLIKTTTNDPLPAAVGVPYVFPLDAFFLRGGTAPFTWTVDAGSALPAGLRIIAGANGVQNYLGGVPTIPGEYEVKVHVADAAGQVMPTTLELFVSQMAITPDAPPALKVGVAATIPITVSGGVPPYMMQLEPDSDMPPGLALVNGALTGTPTTAGNFIVVFTATDALANMTGKAYIMTVDNGSGQAPAFTLTPKPIQAYYEIGGAAPAGVPVAVNTTSGAFPFALSMSGLQGASLSSAAGTTNATKTVNFNPGGLAAGSYVGILAGAAPGTANLFDAVPVTLTVVPTPPCDYAVDPTAKSIPSGGGNGSFNVNAGNACDWATTGPPPSVVAITSGANGTGGGTVTYSVSPNRGVNSRQLIITAGGKQHVITQFGSACAFSINPASLAVGPEGGDALVSLTASDASCAWVSAVGPSGLTFTPSSGTGSTVVTVAIPANASAVSINRNATLGGKALAITQGGVGCSVGLSPYNSSSSASGGPGSVTVTVPNGCSYDSTSNAGWLSVTSGGAGSASGSLAYAVDANSTTTARSGTLLIGGQPFVVNQAAQSCSFTVNTAGLGSPFGPSPATGSVVLTANGSNCTWNASSAAGWAVVTPPSGSGSATIGITIGSNAAVTTARNTDLTIAGQTIPIVQAGTACTYGLQSALGSVPAAGGSGTVGVIAPAVCNYAATSNDPSWLSIPGTGGAGSTDVQFLAQANASPLPRTGSLTIQGLPYTITQAGAPCPYLLVPTNTAVSKDGASGSFTFSTTFTGCSPSALSYVGWITATTTFDGTNGTVDFIVAPNTLASSRAGTIQLGSQSFTITQTAANCGYSLSSYGKAFTMSGGNSSFLGSPSALGCTPPTGTDQPSFIALDPLVGPVLNLFTQGYTVLPFNLVGGYSAVRKGTITFGGQLFTVKQTSW
jgi:hypothetical protein